MQKILRLVVLFPLFVFGQANTGNKNSLPSIEEKTKESKKYEGFVNYYWDENAGKIYIEITRLNEEFLYLVSLPAGLGSNDVGLDRGLTGPGKVVRFVKVGRKILMIQPNYSYRAITNDVAEQRAVEQSFAQSALWGFTVEAETGDHYLVDATDFLLRDVMQVANRLKGSQQGNYILDKTRSALYLTNTKNFPLNTEFEATITFANTDGNTGNLVQSVTPSPEAITVRMHQSFIQLPDKGYKSRVFDPRSSFYDISYFDYSTPVSEPIAKYFICRHRLIKKDPNAAISEPVQPIVYYLDNGTPEPIRSALLEGAQWWNQAFEAAGYKNAFQVKLLPADADPMDIRYNVINWVHRSTRGWSYGASIVDPRTGEIIKGCVTLGSLRVRQDYLIAQGLLSPFDEVSLNENGLPKDDKMLAMALARLKQLAAHEVGHTLGLMHNYISSSDGRASVMDYPHPVVKLGSDGRLDLSAAYDNKIGDWDKVAIMWGYSEFPSGVNEMAELNKILDNAQERGLEFLTDQDARPAGALHPRTHLWDNGKDAVDELKNVVKVREAALKQFGKNSIRTGTPLSMLEDVLVPVYYYHRYQLEAVTKVIGGLNYTYTLKGDNRVPTQPVPKSDQLRALQSVMACMDPGFLEIPPTIASLIPPRPAGYGPSKELFEKNTGLAFDVLSPAEAAVDFPLSFLYNSERLNRMAQYEATGGLGIGEMTGIIIQQTWKSPRKQGVQGLIQLQTEQLLLTYLLASVVNENNSYIVRAVIQNELTDLKTFITARLKTATDETYKGHLELALERIKSPEKAKPSVRKEMPPGAPIGEDGE